MKRDYKNLKILVQNNQFLPVEGGLVTITHNAAKEFVKLGMQVNIL